MTQETDPTRPQKAPLTNRKQRAAIAAILLSASALGAGATLAGQAVAGSLNQERATVLPSARQALLTNIQNLQIGDTVTAGQVELAFSQGNMAVMPLVFEAASPNSRNRLSQYVAFVGCHDVSMNWSTESPAQIASEMQLEPLAKPIPNQDLIPAAITHGDLMTEGLQEVAYCIAGFSESPASQTLAIK